MKGRDIRIRPLEVKPRRTAQNPKQAQQWCSNQFRNIYAIKSAIIRGDTSVTLFNQDHIPQNDFMNIGTDLLDREIGKDQVEVYPLLPSYPENPDPIGDLQVRAIKDIMSKQYSGLKFDFVKVLACGGQGYVSLWDITLDDGSTKRVVIKKGLNKYFNAKKEVAFHLRYDGAEHTTQVIDLGKVARKAQEAMANVDPLAVKRFTQGIQWDAERLGCAVFEYAPYGDVWNLMQAMAARKLKFPDQVLWGIMECFAMGLATIAYTPTGSGTGKPFEEQFRSAERQNVLKTFLDDVESTWHLSHDVHLDLEPLNVLIGEHSSHENQPVFKLHDLGAFSKVMADEWGKMTEADFWTLRHWPKEQAITPEQVSREWDTLSLRNLPRAAQNMFGGIDFKKGTECAGRFGIWTSVFLVAKVMQSMITGVLIRHPFQPEAHQKADGSMGPQTYGWMLQQLQYSTVDLELRDLICMCLYEKPADRPSPVQILRAVQKWKDSGLHNPAEIAQWWEAFHDPQPEPPHQAETPGAKVNFFQQALIDQLGVLALHPEWQLTDTTRKGNGGLAGFNEFTGAGKREADEHGLRVAGPSIYKRPNRATKLRFPGRISRTRSRQVLLQPLVRHNPSAASPRLETSQDNNSVNIPRLDGTLIRNPRARQAVPLDSDSASAPAFAAAPTIVGSDSQHHSAGAVSHLPPDPVIVSTRHISGSPPSSLLMESNSDGLAPAPLSDALTGASTAPSGKTNRDGSGEIGSGEARDIEREEAAYRFDDDDDDNIASPMIPSGQRQDSPPPSGGYRMSINRATQHPTKDAKTGASQQPSKEHKVHKKVLSLKQQKVVRRSRSKKSKALEAYVREAMPYLPVAIRNLMARRKKLEAQLKIGAVPVYAYLN